MKTIEIPALTLTGHTSIEVDSKPFQQNKVIIYIYVYILLMINSIQVDYQASQPSQSSQANQASMGINNNAFHPVYFSLAELLPPAPAV